MSSDEPTVLQEADQIIHGDRALQYGSPADNFKIIAELWTTYLNGKYGCGLFLEAEDYAFMMILAKTGRTTTGRKKRDDIVDIAGYAGTVGMVRYDE